MARNNKIELHGFLGQDAKVIESDGKTFVSLRVATTDSYKDENDKWQDKESIWHEILVFRPLTVQFAKELKKGNLVDITGSISYRPFKDEQGYTRNQATIVAGYIEKANFDKKDEPNSEMVEKALQAK